MGLEKPLHAFFAKRYLKDDYTEERAQFLGEILESSRLGHLCYRTNCPPSLPSRLLSDASEEREDTPFIRQEDRYYLQKNWFLETVLLQEIRRLSQRKTPFCEKFPLFQKKLLETSLIPSQKKAIEQTFSSLFSILYGGPGTGKSYTASIYLRLLLELEGPSFQIQIAAPTGKAASHLQSILSPAQPASNLSSFLGTTCKIEATTLHRLLHLSPNKQKLLEQKRIEADLVVVDEASMVDFSIFAHLLKAIGPKTQLLLIGDPDQLPPVESGSIFAELCSLFGHRLESSLRVEVPELHELANQIRSRKTIDPRFFTPYSFDENLGQTLYEELAFAPFATPQEALGSFSRFRILSALRQGSFGTEALNRLFLQKMQQQHCFSQTWAVPILIVSNRPRLQLYNGTLGVLMGRGPIELSQGIAHFPGLAPIAYPDLPLFELAFCLSIHKSQGSEFERVLALFPPGSERFGKEALYTAVTRAKKEVRLVVEEKIRDALLQSSTVSTSGFKERWNGNAKTI